MAQEYTVIQFKTGNYQDNFGNTWCDVAFEGISEPVRWVVKDPTKHHDGEKVYGDITQETSKQGKAYQRFRTQTRPDNQPQGSQKGQSDEYWAQKDLSIRAQWAIGQSLSKFAEGCYQVTDENRMTLLANIEDFAKELFAMVDVVSGKKQEPSNETASTEEDYQEGLASAFDQDGEINVNDIPF